MTRFLLPLCLLVAGCVVEPEGARLPTSDRQLTDIRPTSPPEVPDVNPPLGARARNYSNGSCVFASTETAIRWMNNDAIASAMRASCRGGSGQARLHENLKRLGVPYVFTSSGSVPFLEWAARTRRCGMVFFFPNHAVSFVGMTTTTVYLIDNNHPKDLVRIERNDFIRRWRGYGGACTVPLASAPAPPL